MAISSPLPFTALSSQPLFVSLSLSSLAAPPSTCSPSLDPFNALDSQAADWSIQDALPPDSVAPTPPPDSEPARSSSSLPPPPPPLPFADALSDSTHSLFPHVFLAAEAELAASQGGTLGGAEGGLPGWLKETSGRVTALTSGRVRRSGQLKREGEEGQGEKRGKGQVRVAVGCQDGTVWVFTDTATWSSGTAGENDEEEVLRSGRDDNSRRRLSADLSSPSSFSFRPTSPISPASHSRRYFSSATASTSSSSAPRIPSRRSSGSISTLASISTSGTRTPRISTSSAASISASSSPPTSPNPGAGTNGLSYQTLRSSSSRPRKASATVSISTSSASAPSSSSHSHPNADDLPDLPTPSLPRSPPPQSPPLTSPNVPHFIFSSPSRPATPSRNSHTGGGALMSRKEGPASSVRSPSLASDAGGAAGRRHHSKAKESIAAGIGLWEGASRAAGLVEDGGGATSTSASASSSASLPAGAYDRAEGTGDAEGGTERMEELRAVLKIRTAGSGEVVALRMVDEEEFGEGAGEGEGAVLVVLRQSGHLTLVSLLDGRSFGSCDVGAHASANSSRNSAVIFSRLQVSTVETTPYAFCSGQGLVVPVRLDSLEAQDGFEVECGDAGVAVWSGQGASFVVTSPSSSSSTSDADSDVDEPLILLSRLTASTTDSTTTLALESAQPIGSLSGLQQPLQHLQLCGSNVLAHDGSSLLLFTIHDDVLAPLGQLDSPDRILEVRADATGEHVAVVAVDRTRVYRLKGRNGEEGLVSFHLISDGPTANVEQVVFLPLNPSSPCLLLASRDGAGTRSLELLSPSTNATPASLYRSAVPAKQARVTSVKLLSGNRVLLGFSTGSISLIDLADLAASAAPSPVRAALAGAITLLDVVEIEGRQVVVGGTSSGMAGVWDLSDWTFLGSWTLFASPVKSYAYISPSPTSASALTSPTLAFISANSPVALISLPSSPSPTSSPASLLFVLPGTKSSVELIATTKDEIMVLYEQGLARTCDIGSRELRRSMDRRTAERALKEGEGEGAWTVWFRLAEGRREGGKASQTDPLLSLDLRSFLDEATRHLPWTESKSVKKREVLPSLSAASVSTSNTPNGSPNPQLSNGASSPPPPPSQLQGDKDERGAARRLIAALATFGVDEAVDEMLAQLGIEPLSAEVGVAVESDAATSLPASSSPQDPWRISPVATAQRLLRLVCLLRIFLNYPETERIASEAIVYYASCFADSVGADFAEPSLDVFASFWLDKNTEIQQAARSLFGTYLAAMSDDRILAFVEGWQAKLPARQQGAGVLHEQADHALLVVGLVATERYKLLSSAVLKDLSESISTYLQDPAHPQHQAIATELCSRGFGIWQNYVDAMSLVRQLFAIAIGRNPATPNDLRLLARNATMHVAGVNTPLFMTTLIHDILNAPTAQARNATLKLLGFMIRKKPLVLYTGLPRVAEAVVKSLDPTVSSLRETVHQAATVILSELVRTFPSIDFHSKSQRLAVGTHEGAAIVFDLRTATRLYVLEGHTRPVTALSWSPDGHRLVTVSLEESRVAAWKVATGLFSMFTAGAPPRQVGGSSATPFKTYDFHVGDEGLMTTAAALEWVVFDWPAERTVRLRLRETALNFGV